MASKYQKQHYEDVARLLVTTAEHGASVGSPTDLWVMATEHLAIRFADLFMNDNPLFDRERFLVACGLDDN